MCPVEQKEELSGLFFVLFNLEMLVKFNFSQNSRTRTTPISRAFDCGFCLFGRAFDQLFFQKSNSPGVARGGGLIAVGFDSYINLSFFLRGSNVIELVHRGVCTLNGMALYFILLYSH
jgi:hypothetical protein